MAHNHERGQALVWAAVIFLFTAVGTLIAAVLMVRHRDDVKAEVTRLQVEVARVRSQAETLQTHIQHIADRTPVEGLTETAGYVLEDPQPADDKERVTRMTVKLTDALQEQRVALYRAMLSREGEDVTLETIHDVGTDEVPLTFLRSLSEAAPLWVSLIEYERGRAEAAEGGVAAAQTANQAFQRVDQELTNPQDPQAMTKDRLINLLTAQTQRLEQARAADEAALNQRIGTLRAETQQLDQQRQQEEYEWEREHNRLEAQISRRRADLEQMRVREAVQFEVREAHGHILHPDVDGRMAHIDLGSRQGIAEGMIFRVARVVRHGLFEFKGVVEVRQVDETMAAVQVVGGTNEWAPIVEGDLIVNPFYHPRHPPVVGLIGRDRAAGMTMSAGDALQAMAVYGAQSRATPTSTPEGVRWSTAITPDLDFVIITDQYEQDDAYRQAIQLEIPIARAEDVLPFLSR